MGDFDQHFDHLGGFCSDEVFTIPSPSSLSVVRCSLLNDAKCFVSSPPFCGLSSLSSPNLVVGLVSMTGPNRNIRSQP